MSALLPSAANSNAALVAAGSALAANRLSDGITVWAIAHGDSFRWTEDWSRVTPVDDASALEAFAAGEAAADEIVSERVIEVLTDGRGGYTPQRLRERICTAGPTIASILVSKRSLTRGQPQRRA